MSLSPAWMRNSTAGNNGRNHARMSDGGVADSQPDHHGRVVAANAALGKVSGLLIPSASFRCLDDNGEAMLPRSAGARGGWFFSPARAQEGHRLTPEVLTRAQDMLDRGSGIPVIAQELGVLASTLHKAIDSGRLRRVKK